MVVKVSCQIENLLHFVEVEDEDAAVSLVSRAFAAKMQGVPAFQLNARTFVDTRTLNLMKVRE